MKRHDHPSTHLHAARRGKGLRLSLAGLACAGWASVAVASTSVPAAAPAITLVAPASEVAFTIKQMGVPVSGQFKRFSVQTNFNPKAPQASQVAMRFELASATVSPDADAELGAPEWFATARFPQATFQSSAIKATGPGRFEVAGKLSIKGTTRDVVVPMQLTQAGAQSTVTGSFALKRLDFKVGDGDWADPSFVANDVQVRFKLVLQGVPAQ
jgi:polyisoprenoid-binding protein YceI